MLTIEASITLEEKGKKAPKWELEDVGGKLTLEQFFQEMRSTIIAVAGEALREEQAKGFDKQPVIVTDNKKNKPVSQVSPLGKIEIFARQSINKILVEAFQKVWDNSPVDTGFYKEHHLVLFKGAVIAKNPTELQNWVEKANAKVNDGDTFRIVNVTPYAFRLERLGVRAGKTRRRVVDRGEKRRGNQLQRKFAPNGAYYLASRAVRRKYKNLSKIFFEQINGRSVAGAVFPSSGPHGALRTTFSKKANAKGWKGSYTYPCIRIIVDSRGVNL